MTATIALVASYVVLATIISGRYGYKLGKLFDDQWSDCEMRFYAISPYGPPPKPEWGSRAYLTYAGVVFGFFAWWLFIVWYFQSKKQFSTMRGYEG